jgi:hypothetical protein
MRIQMDFGLNVNMIPMVMKSIMRLQMYIGGNKNLIPMVIKSIMRIQRVILNITDQRVPVMVRL